MSGRDYNNGYYRANKEEIEKVNNSYFMEIENLLSQEEIHEFETFIIHRFHRLPSEKGSSFRHNELLYFLKRKEYIKKYKKLPPKRYDNIPYFVYGEKPVLPDCSVGFVYYIISIVFSLFFKDGYIGLIGFTIIFIIYIYEKYNE